MKIRTLILLSARFDKEVAEIVSKYDSVLDPQQDVIVFTGSSSIRLWDSLQAAFPDRQILNTGFGGSQMSDLLVFADRLILQYQPVQVFVYEGDNDIFARKKPKQVTAQYQQLIKMIREADPSINIVLISTKPSPARWRFRGKYKRLNKKLAALSEADPQIDYVDVWSIMLDGKKPRKDIFIEDDLHMNQKGYDLWYDVIKDYLN